MSRSHARRRAALCVAVAVTIAGCTGGSSDDPVAVVVTTTTEPPQPRVDDGVLLIGALIPGGDTAIGAPLGSALTASVAAVNGEGGVLGSDVRLVIQDEGATATAAAQAIGALLAANVDAIIGPTSSNSAIGALDEVVAAGAVACSPTATAIALDDFPDEGLFFRSIASDSLQAVAIARRAVETGASGIAVVHVDDAYGRPFADATIDALESIGSFAITRVSVAVDDDDLVNELDDLGASGAQTAIVLGSGPDTGRFLEALAQRDGIALNDIVVNDAARDAAVRPVVAGLPAALRNRISGIAPQIVLPAADSESDDPADLPFASQVADCVNLIALAAVQGGSDSPDLIADQMASVSSGGSVCRSFGECVQQIERGLQINYDGATGVTEIGRDGDPSRARFDQFGFTADGSDEFQRDFIVQR
jgi:branched-chain amino acid transport system substrate-binding protein